MKIYFKRMAALLLALLLLASLGACSLVYDGAAEQFFGDALKLIEDEPSSDASSESESKPDGIPANNADEEPPAEDPAINEPYKPDEDGWYYQVEEVVEYLNAYGRLPSNYITKKNAEKLGWQGGSIQKLVKGAAIGGDRFGNYEGLLPKAPGRQYYECDIDTDGKNSRGAKRLIYSSDGLYFYTDDHYESYSELYITQDGTAAWK